MKCSVCGTAMVPCDRLGRPVAGGGYTVCPKALREHAPAEFRKPWQARKHREVRICESAAHAKQRRAAERREMPLLFDDVNVGRRLKG